MAYTIETKLAPKQSWHTPAEAKAYYGRYARDGITVHWWGGGEQASAHDSIVNYFLAQGKQGIKSVNYVLSDNKITMMVHPDNVAWASQSGNPVTVSIEFQPTLHAEGYKKGGWLIWQLEKRYGKGLKLYPHKYWFPTSCPGTIDLNRLRSEANKWRAGGYNPTPPPPPKPAPEKASLSWTKFAAPKDYVTNKTPTKLWDFDSTTWTMKAVKEFPKGTKLKIYGKVVNNTLGATYLLTQYSYDKKITNGFNQTDMDAYVPPPPAAPAPTPPPAQQPKPLPSNPPAPVPAPTLEQRVGALEKLGAAMSAFLKKLGFGG